MTDNTSSANLGMVILIRGSVVDVHFATHLPPIHSLLLAQEGKITIEVLAQLDAHCIRGIALTSTQSPVSDIAIKGYDTVAYFQAGKALKGNESFTFQWHNLTWYFQGKENRDLFATGPERFAPQYDGYCAWALTEERKAVTDPEVWKIVDGKLYLNCSMGAYEKWSKDIPGNIKKADANGCIRSLWSISNRLLSENLLVLLCI